MTVGRLRYDMNDDDSDDENAEIFGYQSPSSSPPPPESSDEVDSDDMESADEDLLEHVDHEQYDFEVDEPELSGSDDDPAIMEFASLAEAELELSDEEEDKPELEPVKHLRPTCPISYKLLKEDNAVGTPYGHVFDRETLEKCLEDKKRCPITRYPLSSAGLFKPTAFNQAQEYSAALEVELKRVSDEKERSEQEADQERRRLQEEVERVARERERLQEEKERLARECDRLRLHKRKFKEVYELIGETPAAGTRSKRPRLSR